MIRIGIDPAFRQKGIGFCILDGKEVIFKQYSIIELLNDINAGCFKSASVCVENSKLQNTSFDMAGSKSVVARKSRNVGANQAVSQIICDAIRFKCAKFLEISPLKKGEKFLDSSIIEGSCKLHKWTMNKKRLNQDDRDAFKLMLLAK